MIAVSPVVTDEQRRQFAVSGFVVFRQLFTAEEVERYGRAMEDVFRRLRGDTDYDGNRAGVSPLLEYDPDVFYPLFDDDRLVGIADGLLGEDCLWTAEHGGNLYVGDTSWHPDGSNYGEYAWLKIAFYCDPVSDGRGCLSVIPGSHHADYARALDRGHGIGCKTMDLPGRVPLESTPGDVVAFDVRLWHSSWGGQAGRRMFTFCYVPYPKVSWQEFWLRGQLTTSRGSGPRLCSDRLWETGDARRRRKLAKLYEWGI